MIANRRLHARHVVGVDQRPPIRRLRHVDFVVAQHGLPARREIYAIVEGVEVPESVVGAIEGKLIALFQIAQSALNLDAFQAGREAAAQQLHEQVQLHFPGLARRRARDPQQARGTPFNRIADEEHRTNEQLAPQRGVLDLIGPRLRRIADFRHAQRREPPLEPGHRGHVLAA